jgi:hypothetical protein
MVLGAIAIHRVFKKFSGTKHLHFKWIPPISASGVLRLLKGEIAVAASKFNWQLWTFDRWWSSNLWLRRSTNKTSGIT